MTLLLAILVLSGAARAQDYPTKAIKLVMPFVPGSPVDAVGRVIMQHLQGRLGQSIVIENRPGGGTTLGAKAAAVAAPDGYTLLFIGPNLAYYPVLFPNLDFDPKSLTPVATTVTWSHVYGVASPVPAKTIAELVTHAKANPGKLAWARHYQRALSRRRRRPRRPARRPHPYQRRAGAADDAADPR
jgi:tripartite-type tricarboxylate transporter receptor subunit TctC